MQVGIKASKLNYIMPNYIQVLYLGTPVLNQKARGFVFKKSFQQGEVHRKEMGKMERQGHKFVLLTCIRFI